MALVNGVVFLQYFTVAVTPVLSVHKMKAIF